ncbi:hypothetical protein OS493_024958 [Desmophyllum pertusum]|uniref:Uncharacterized protein n=1 Tax=Desmophyllum pertusum TaxID=174260 RepID=A0A9W9YLM4_9CNID|nr:hypothetical protein OS493_024958 [Desmophyllum pertusum]
MEHKIDQLMAMIGAKSSIGMDGLQIGNQFNATAVGNQSNATAVRNQSNAMPVRNQSHITAVRNQLNATAVRNQSNVTTVRNQSNVTGRNHLNATMVRNQFNSSTRGTQNNATTSNQANRCHSGAPIRQNVTMTATPSNTTVNAPAVMVTQSKTHLNDPENQEDADTMMEYQLSALTPLSRSAPFKTSQSLPGMSARQRIQLEMAKITEQILPDDLELAHIT